VSGSRAPGPSVTGVSEAALLDILGNKGRKGANQCPKSPYKQGRGRQHHFSMGPTISPNGGHAAGAKRWSGCSWSGHKVLFITSTMR